MFWWEQPERSAQLIREHAASAAPLSRARRPAGGAPRARAGARRPARRGPRRRRGGCRPGRPSADGSASSSRSSARSVSPSSRAANASPRSARRVPLEPDPRRQAVGAEVAGDVAQQLQRARGCRPGGAAGPRARRPRRRWRARARAPCAARPRRRPPPARRPRAARARRRTARPSGRLRADELADDLAVLERLDGRDPLDAERLGERGVGVGVELGQDDLALARGGGLASSSGPSWRHGPHHSAQKSTTTGTVADWSITSAWKSCSLTSITVMAHRVGECRSGPSARGSDARGRRRRRGDAGRPGSTGLRRLAATWSWDRARWSAPGTASSPTTHAATAPPRRPRSPGVRLRAPLRRPRRGPGRVRARPGRARRRLDGRPHDPAPGARGPRARRGARGDHAGLRARRARRRGPARAVGRAGRCAARRRGGGLRGRLRHRGGARGLAGHDRHRAAPAPGPARASRRGRRCAARGAALAPVRRPPRPGVGGVPGGRRGQPRRGRPRPSRWPSARPTPTCSRRRRLVVEEEGRSPLAWQGGQLSKVIAELAAEAW